jgi:uncharacterized protein (DUF1800 family)
MSILATIATNRFGLGARPNEQKVAQQDPKNWLIKQLKVTPAVTFNLDLPDSLQISKQLAAIKKQKKIDKQAQASMKMQTMQAEPKNNKAPNYSQQIFRQLSADTLTQAISSENSLNWRLLDFFSNHFSVTAQGAVMTALAPTLEREAIAPHLHAKFEDMLLAVCKHPAMLIYLNNDKSAGPNSRYGKKKHRGLNENLAREILELHTLGVDADYKQTDVRELAKGITGWSITLGKQQTSGFKFRPFWHEPGERKLLNKVYPQKNSQQGEAMLIDLARHPDTAQHLCYKLARHFISDNPQQSLVNKLVVSWQQSQGNIAVVMQALISATESWQTKLEKFKTPREFIISCYRALAINTPNGRQLHHSLTSLGQQPFKAGSPAGYSDLQQNWDGSSALMARIDWTSVLASKVKSDSQKIMQETLADSVSERTYQIVKTAESQQQALTLLLLSPEFQRR